jgi:hypothetical protein
VTLAVELYASSLQNITLTVPIASRAIPMTREVPVIVYNNLIAEERLVYSVVLLGRELTSPPVKPIIQ